jgi:hypothetical protein
MTARSSQPHKGHRARILLIPSSKWLITHVELLYIPYIYIPGITWYESYDYYTHGEWVPHIHTSHPGANVCLEMANVVRAAGQQAAPGSDLCVAWNVVNL